MAVGDLSPDQQRYRTVLVAGTGLSSVMVTAWIGAESGWNVTKPDHNYLNIGPGRNYPSADAAALAAVQLLTSSSNYSDIIHAKTASDEIAALIASPWDAEHYANGTLQQIFQDLGGTTAPNPTGTPTTGTPPIDPTTVSTNTTNPFTAIRSFMDFVTNKNNWQRLGIFLAGIAALLLAFSTTKVGKSVINKGKEAAGMAAMVAA